MVNDLQNGCKSCMKFLFHANYTILFIFYKGMQTCNIFQGGFRFLVSCIGSIYYSSIGNAKLIMNKYLVNQNSLTTNLSLYSTIFSLFLGSQKIVQYVLSWCSPLWVEQVLQTNSCGPLSSFESIFIHCNIF